MERYDGQSVGVLGVGYTIYIKNYNDDEFLKTNEWEGYCSYINKEIILADTHTLPGAEGNSESVLLKQLQKTLRHELTHAFLHESGLASNSYATPSSWAENEEMVDWFALQSPKIFKLFNELELL